MHRDLLEVLADPDKGLPLSLEPDYVTVDDEIISGELHSDDGTRYEIRDGVARMVPEADSSVRADEGATQRSFGAKWEQYEESDKDQLAEFQYRWFDERFGFGGESGFALLPCREAPRFSMPAPVPACAPRAARA